MGLSGCGERKGNKKELGQAVRVGGNCMDRKGLGSVPVGGEKSLIVWKE